MEKRTATEVRKRGRREEGRHSGVTAGGNHTHTDGAAPSESTRRRTLFRQERCLESASYSDASARCATEGASERGASEQATVSTGVCGVSEGMAEELSGEGEEEREGAMEDEDEEEAGVGRREGEAGPSRIARRIKGANGWSAP